MDVQSTANSPDTNQNFVNPPTSTLNSTNTVKSKRPLEEDTNAAETSSTAPAPSSPIAHVAKKARRGRQSMYIDIYIFPVCNRVAYIVFFLFIHFNLFIFINFVFILFIFSFN